MKKLSTKWLLNDVKGWVFGQNFRKTDFFFQIYYSPSQNNQYCFDILNKTLGVYSDYQKGIPIGDLDVGEHEAQVHTFLY